MASDWTLHSKSNRWIRSVYNHSGEFLYEWDYPGGALTLEIAGQDSSQSVVAHQRSSGSAFSKPKDAGNAYGHQTPFVPGPECHASRLNHVQRQDQLDFGQTYTNDRMGLNPQSKPTEYQQLTSPRLNDGIFSISGTVTDNEASSPHEWIPELQYEVARKTTGRRTECASISDHSESTISPRSDASISQVHVDGLQGLSLGDYPASHMVRSYGASSHSHRNDPMLGDFRRKYDKKMQDSLEPAYVIPGSNGEHETLDPRYKRQSDARKFFRVGRVFSMLWHENAGWHGTVLSDKVSPPSSSPFTRGKYQEPIYSSIRRMVVVKEQRGCCWCVPITTYSGKGVAKAGIDRSKHAVIYMRGSRPRTVQSEPRMAKEPLEVDPARPDQKLDSMSRVNFGKVYTVEHNVKVLPVGKITEGSRARFLEYAQAEFLR
ncbi:hypothetical protein PITC_059870 [Penicillium italicum]|uniref:DUF6590 domain-containing protein n=1 Tax=Penicillium italicum TaxID=40296 RepID=A0A0A2LBR2_PENIT|nr:hypothetical protein PITC_059870 [Penicillium italicum]